jgi:acetaldehyde dehydrogenase / alcohol dehydrogenase
MVCIPTTSGTGSEVTPFSVVTDEKTGMKYPLADYFLTPRMAIVDPQVKILEPHSAWNPCMWGKGHQSLLYLCPKA